MPPYSGTIHSPPPSFFTIVIINQFLTLMKCSVRSSKVASSYESLKKLKMTPTVTQTKRFPMMKDVFGLGGFHRTCDIWHDPAWKVNLWSSDRASPTIKVGIFRKICWYQSYFRSQEWYLKNASYLNYFNSAKFKWSHLQALNIVPGNGPTDEIIEVKYWKSRCKNCIVLSDLVKNISYTSRSATIFCQRAKWRR